MPRAKKAKIQEIEETYKNPATADADEMAQGEGAPRSPSRVAEATSAALSPLTKQEEALDLYLEACERADKFEEDAKRARQAYRLAERLCDAKEKRLNAKPKRTLKNPWAKVRRGYEMIIELIEASRDRERAESRAAQAKADARGCLIVVQDLEIARLKRELRHGR